MFPEFLENNLRWWISGAIVVLGLFVYGLSDFRKLVLEGGIKRAWAISGVCFAESIRRRVLWIAPLAILGVLGVSQFIRGGEQDIVRQTIKYSLFATGLVVSVTAIILACTNLPKEIDTRVIYTIVTKPTTRLEIVVGKVIGFAKVSLAILLIMGLFTFGYAHLRAWTLEREIRSRLEAGTVDSLARPTYEFWANQGLLSSRSFAHATKMQVFAKEPTPGDSRRWFFGGGDGDILVPFYLNREMLIPEGVPNANPGDGGLLLRLNMGFAQSAYTEAESVADVTLRASTAPSGPPQAAAVSVEFLDANLDSLISSTVINQGRPLTLTDPTGNTPAWLAVSPELTRNLLRSPFFFVNVIGVTRGVQYSVDVAPPADTELAPVCLYIPGDPPEQRTRLIGPLGDGTPGRYIPIPPAFRGKGGLYGQLLRGGSPERSPVAVFEYRDAVPDTSEKTVPFELRVRIELSSREGDESEVARFEVVAVNRATGQRSAPQIISPESNRTTHFSLPIEPLADGNFDLYLRNLGTGHFATLREDSLQAVVSEDSFNANLLRSLGILWMLSILVVIISICCSTFLSWPIAIVLTLLLLLGHWLIMQVSDSLAPGIGNLVAQDIFGAGGAGEARVVSQFVEAMARVLNQMANVLPDISRFSAVEDIERGITISAGTFLAPLEVLLAFGLPMLVLSYVFLRNKEVAP